MDLVAGVTPQEMRLVPNPSPADEKSEIETIDLDRRHAELLEKLSRGINPEMPREFGQAHAIRLLLDYVEKAEIDLTHGATEDEATALATPAITRRRTRRRR